MKPLSELGKVQSKINLIIGIPIAIIVFIISIFLLTNNNDGFEKITGKVISSNCSIKNTKNSNLYECYVKVNYEVNDIAYNNYLSLTSQKPINLHQNLDFLYDVNNPNNIKQYSNTKTMGIIFLVISLLAIGGLILNYYFVHNSKTYASYQGASTVGNFLKNIFKK